MIVTRLRLHPFGCFADREVRFGSTLNVVLGPNEAGKSTLFHAARTALLRTRLTSAEFARHIGRFVPAGGGDTVGVEVDFLAPDGAYLLRRRWGSSPQSELVLPGGELLTDDEAVKERLERILPARQAAFWGVLFTGQSELTRIVESLRKESAGALADLTDILRKSVLDTGGVSADRFRAELEARIARAFDNWDAGRSCPRSNRGIDNPWRRGVGLILESHYERERLARALRQARDLEREVDQANRQLREVTGAFDGSRRFLDQGRKAYDDARERRVLEAGLAAARSRHDELARLVREWPVAESRREEHARRLQELRARLVELAAERGRAERAEIADRLREKLSRVERMHSRAADAREKLAGVPVISRSDVEAIRSAEQAVRTARARLSTSAVLLTLKASAPLDVELVRDAGTAERVTLEAGSPRSFRAERLIRVRHGGLDVEAQSGEADIEARRKDLETALTGLRELLERHSVSGAEQADERERANAALAQAVEGAERELAEELGGERLDDLRSRASPPVETGAPRALAVVAAEMATAEAEIRERTRELDDVDRRIRGWEDAHASLQGLIDSLAEARRGAREIEGRIASSAPLPSGFPAAASFVAAYEAAAKEQERLAERRADIRTRKAALEAKLPDQSSEELEAQLEQASARFAAALGQGKALLRVQEVTRRLLSSSDREVFAEMKEELGRLVAVMSAGRYREVELAGSVPRALVNRGGAPLGWERLSAGTRDLLALALRLAMAGRFLGGSRGFVMMDDPLVEMDPTRQAAAASALKAFAESRQLVVFTCHPSHAELLGGNRIEL